MHLLHFAVYLILTGIRVCDSFEPTMHSGHPVIIESGFHPCVDGINYTYLAFQGHCRRVMYSFRNVSPWKSLLLALSGDISLNLGPASRSLKGPRWQSGNTLASHLCGRGSIPVMAVSGKAGSCLPLVGSLQYTTLANSMYWFPLPFQLPVVI